MIDSGHLKAQQPEAPVERHDDVTVMVVQAAACHTWRVPLNGGAGARHVWSSSSVSGRAEAVPRGRERRGSDESRTGVGLDGWRPVDQVGRAVAVGGGFRDRRPTGRELTGVEKNDNSAWLPGSAEATKVLDQQHTFQPKDTAPAIVVYERKSGLIDTDVRKAEADARTFAGYTDFGRHIWWPSKLSTKRDAPQTEPGHEPAYKYVREPRREDHVTG
jgi:hypothetical protein